MAALIAPIEVPVIIMA